MAQLLRSLGLPLRRAVLQPLGQQKRFAGGDLYYKSNPHIEQWSHRRENIEHEFQWDRATTWNVIVWGVVIPIGLFKLITRFQQYEDEWAAREEKPYLWSGYGSSNEASSD